MSNNRARSWLESQGFSCEEEPDWITDGQKPDFFCTGLFELWVEVKTLTHEERVEQLAEAHQEIRERAKGIKGNVQVAAWVNHL